MSTLPTRPLKPIAPRNKGCFRLTLMTAMLMSTLNSNLTPIVHAAETAVAQTPWSVDFAGPRGVSVSYHNVPIIRRSSLYVVKPGWSGLIYDQRAQKHDVLKKEDGSLRVTGTDEEFRAE